MSDLSVRMNGLRNEADNLNSAKVSLYNYKEKIESIMNGLSISGVGASSIKRSLKSCVTDIEKISKSTNQMQNVLKEVADCYQKTEQKISNSIIINDDTNNIKNEETSDVRETSNVNNKEQSKEEKEKEFIENYEYEYSEDNIAVPINIEFLDKHSCLDMADRIIEEHGEDGMCNGMTKRRIAKELYAHAIGYFFASELENMGIDGNLVQGTIESGKVADIGLGDGLDIHYELIWDFFDPFKLVD